MSNKDLLEYYVRKRSEIEAAADPRQLFFLDYLHEYGPMSLDNLTSDTGFDRSLVVQIIDSLLAGGLVSGKESGDRWMLSSRGKLFLNSVIGSSDDNLDLGSSPLISQAIGPSSNVEERASTLLTARDLSPQVWGNARDHLVFYFAKRHGMANAEDLAQETLAAVLGRENYEFHKEEDFLKVCYSIARSIAHSIYREQSRPSEFHPAFNPPESRHLKEGEARVLLAEVLQLAKKNLTGDEWSLIEAAGRLADDELTPTGRLRLRLYRARKKLAKLTGWHK